MPVFTSASVGCLRDWAHTNFGCADQSAVWQQRVLVFRLSGFQAITLPRRQQEPKQGEESISSVDRGVHAWVISYRIGQVISAGQARRTAHGQSLGHVLPEQERIGDGAHNRNSKKVSIARNLETAIEFLTASPPTGPLPTKPAELMFFFTGTDSFQAASASCRARRDISSWNHVLPAKGTHFSDEPEHCSKHHCKPHVLG